MRKIYFLGLLIFSLLANLNGQFTDDMEAYSVGPIDDANPMLWSTWSGTLSGPEVLQISQNYASSGTNSGYVGFEGSQDVLLLLDNKTIGVWELEFKMYIPAGRTGYFNFQGTTAANGGTGGGGNGVFNSTNLVWNNTQSGTGGAGIGGAYPNVDGEPNYTWTYNEDAWNDVKFVFNADSSTFAFYVNETLVIDKEFEGNDTSVGGIDFFSLDSNNEFYVDDFSFEEVIQVDVQTLEEDAFTVFPNPVTTQLQIEAEETVDMLTLYSIMGAKLSEVKSNVTNPTLDMSIFPSGTYIVKVTIDGASRNVKVVK